MTKIKLVPLLLVLFCYISNAQNKTDSLYISFALMFNKLPIESNKQYITNSNDTISLETFKCYISAIQIHYSDKTVFTQTNSYHLLDFDNPSSFQIPITKANNKTISKVTFNMGIDSLTNTSGALEGDLDPINGMYWAWQSGYINMKLEGKSASCKTRKNEFHFHVGGYLPPYATMRKIELIYNKKATQINIGMEVNNFFSNIKLTETNNIMIPGKLAMELAEYTTKLFYIE